MSVSVLTTALLLTSTPISVEMPSIELALLKAPIALAPDEQATPPAAGASTEPASAEPAQDIEHGEIVVRARPRITPGDPLLQLNAESFAITQKIDVAFVRPVAKTYQKILPAPIRDGIRNIINNLREPVAFLNFMLQLKPGKAFETVGRFAINSTVGLAGAFDVARYAPVNLPRRPNGFANTLGYYGVKPGAFLFVPLVGPTTIRDFIGDGLDRLVLPVLVGKPFSKPVYGTAIYVFSSLDQRAEFDEKLQELHNETSDPYVASREDYLERRQAAIDALHAMGKEKPISKEPDAKPQN